MSEEVAPSSASPENAVRLGRFPDRLVATLTQSRLVMEGIDSWLVGGYGFEGAEVLVRREDLERADAILGTIKLGLEDQVRRGDRPTCMDCDSENLEFPNPPPARGLRRAVWNFFHERVEVRCRDCGYSWLARL